MRIPRLYHPEPLSAGTEFVLATGAFRHCVTVLRLRPGAALVLFDGAGGEYPAELLSLDGGARVRTGEQREPGTESTLPVTLIQAVAKGERMDYAIQKAVELGVARVLPVMTERSVVKLDGTRGDKRRRHWQDVAIAACEQSGRTRVPTVEAPASLSTALVNMPRDGQHLLLDPEADTGLHDIARPPALSVAVGPEGGWSDSERQQLETAGFQGVRLGPRVLRTETAGPALLAAVQTLWGDMR